MKELLAALAIAAALIASGIVYPQTFVVTEASEETGLLLETGSGLQYRYYIPGSGCDDLEAGDLVSAIVYNGGTPDDVRDDEIMSIRYSGLRAERNRAGIILLKE